jgi:hypothetical protein
VECPVLGGRASILLFVVGEVTAFHIVDISAHGIMHDCGEVGVAA